jgi:two-component system response regulator CpxR
VGRHILVIDNDEAVRMAIAEVLSDAGWQVEEACDGLEALEALRREPLPGLVLVDLMMPRMSGWELLRTMESTPALARLPAIVLTAFDRAEDLPRGCRVLHKPIDAEVLLTEVAEAQEAWHAGQDPVQLERPA